MKEQHQPQRLNRFTTPRLTGHRNQCAACLRAFASQSGFDRHRTGRFGVDRRCMSPAELHVLGMRQDSSGFWRLSDANAAPTQRPGINDRLRGRPPYVQARIAPRRLAVSVAEGIV